MTNTNRFDDAAGMSIRVVTDATDAACTWIGVGSTDHLALLAAGEVVLPYARPIPTAVDVRTECRRRMRHALRAADEAHLDQIIADGAREAIRLILKGPVGWTEEEIGRSIQLEMADRTVEALRGVASSMEGDPPSDLTSDAKWQIAGDIERMRRDAVQGLGMAMASVRSFVSNYVLKYEMAARALAGDEGARSALQAEAIERGISVDALAAAIGEKRALADAAVAAASASELRGRTQVAAAQSPSDILTARLKATEEIVMAARI